MYTQEITVEQGQLKGLAKDGYNFYGAIPYAKAPIGDLRYRRPQTAEKFTDTYLADNFPNKCPQNPQTGFFKKEFYEDSKYNVNDSEDCLYLNIWTPTKKAASPYPVAVYIHGGAFMGGYNSEVEFNGANFAKKGIVLVTINYRLGIFGFLAHPDLSAENKEHISGNYGIFDQIAALKWIKKNIAAFGGDANNITIFGQSAGAMSVQTLCSSPLTKNLFNAAIMESGAGYKNSLNYDLSLAQAEEIGKNLFKIFDIDNVVELRKIPTQTLLAKFNQYMGNLIKRNGGFLGLDLPMVPNIDGYLLPEGYDKTIENGHLHQIPYLLGSNSNDIGTSKDKEFGDLYEGARNLAEKENEITHNPVYLYYFKRQMPGDNAGAFHSAELWYVFGNLDHCWRPLTEADYRLSNDMMNNWINFFKTYKPLKDWRPYTEENKFIKQFDI